MKNKDSTPLVKYALKNRSIYRNSWNKC